MQFGIVRIAVKTKAVSLRNAGGGFPLFNLLRPARGKLPQPCRGQRLFDIETNNPRFRSVALAPRARAQDDQGRRGTSIVPARWSGDAPHCLPGLRAGYQSRHSRMGRKMAGRWFMILSLVTPSMLRPRPMIKTEPTQVISAMAISPKKGEMTPASRVMLP